MAPWEVWIPESQERMTLAVPGENLPVFRQIMKKHNVEVSEMPQRLTYRRRLCYNTKSNKTKVSKTPGGRIVFLYRKKKGSVARCGDTGVKLKGIKPARPRQLHKMTKRLKRVTRAYGGCLSAAAVRERIIRAFLIEEQKIVARVLKAKIKAEKK